jgi:hypothetical protein
MIKGASGHPFSFLSVSHKWVNDVLGNPLVSFSADVSYITLVASVKRNFQSISQSMTQGESRVSPAASRTGIERHLKRSPG